MREKYTERERQREGKRERKKRLSLVSPVALTGIREGDRGEEGQREENIALKIRTLYQIVISF